MSSCTIRRRVDILHSEISPKIRGQLDAQKEKWQECALDVWQEHRLKHLWDIAIPFGNNQEFLFDPAKGIYAFQEGVDNEEEGEEELVFIHTEPSTQEEPPPPEVSTAGDDEQATQPMSLPSEQPEGVPPQSCKYMYSVFIFQVQVGNCVCVTRSKDTLSQIETCSTTLHDHNWPYYHHKINVYDVDGNRTIS